MEIIKRGFLTGERALFQGKDLRIEETIFDDPETDALFKENFPSAKAMIVLWRKDIFESGSVEYSREHVDPFD